MRSNPAKMISVSQKSISPKAHAAPVEWTLPLMLPIKQAALAFDKRIIPTRVPLHQRNERGQLRRGAELSDCWLQPHQEPQTDLRTGFSVIINQFEGADSHRWFAQPNALWDQLHREYASENLRTYRM